MSTEFHQGQARRKIIHGFHQQANKTGVTNHLYTKSHGNNENVPYPPPDSWLDAYLVGKVRRGDRRAFGKLYDRNAGRVYYLLKRLTGDSEAAADLTQETFVAAYSSLNSWGGCGAFGSWLCGIATRQYRARKRLAGRELATETYESEEVPTLSSDSGDPLTHCTYREAESALDTAILSLSDSCREAFVLVRIEGMRYQEAAALLGVPLGTLQSRLDRATRVLRTRLSFLVDATDSVESSQSVEGPRHVL